MGLVIYDIAKLKHHICLIRQSLYVHNYIKIIVLLLYT